MKKMGLTVQVLYLLVAAFYFLPAIALSQVQDLGYMKEESTFTGKVVEFGRFNPNTGATTQVDLQLQVSPDDAYTMVNPNRGPSGQLALLRVSGAGPNELIILSSDLQLVTTFPLLRGRNTTSVGYHFLSDTEFIYSVIEAVTGGHTLKVYSYDLTASFPPSPSLIHQAPISPFHWETHLVGDDLYFQSSEGNPRYRVIRKINLQTGTNTVALDRVPLELDIELSVGDNSSIGEYLISSIGKWDRPSQSMTYWLTTIDPSVETLYQSQPIHYFAENFFPSLIVNDSLFGWAGTDWVEHSLRTGTVTRRAPYPPCANQTQNLRCFIFE
ncbi:hypothetical protein MRY87_04015 [bacterium]|nr:hypothetical protein [bacterium]